MDVSAHPYTSVFAPALGESPVVATLKSTPADFVVDETLSFPLSGQGQHLYLQIEKIAANTEWVARQLARHFAVPVRDVGYAGLKDRQAVTRQWFSVPIEQRDTQLLATLSIPGVTVLQTMLHERKLRRGAVLHNAFSIILRELDGDLDELARRLECVRKQGVPNYFDAQRFGIQRQNLLTAQALFEKRVRLAPAKRGIFLSAARAWLFNHILARRVREASWDQACTGDVFWLEGTKRFFAAPVDQAIVRRVAEGDIHPTGALWGEGEVQSQAGVANLEREVAAQWPLLRDGLVRFGLAQDRRPLRVFARDFAYVLDAAKKNLQVTFKLPAGSYATTLLGELVSVVHPKPTA